MALIRVVQVRVGREPEVVEVEGEDGIRALLGGRARVTPYTRLLYRDAVSAAFYGSGDDDGDAAAGPNFQEPEGELPEMGDRVIALVDPDGRGLVSMGEIDSEVWLWRILKWRLPLAARS